jgi:hypothetical protein
MSLRCLDSECSGVSTTKKPASLARWFIDKSPYFDGADDFQK